MKKIKETFNTLLKVLILLWSSSKLLLSLTLIMSFITGAMTPISLWIWKNIIDIISNLLIGVQCFDKLYKWLVIYFTANLLIKIVSSISEYVTIIYSEYLDMNIKDTLLSKVCKFNLADFDDSETYNELSKASNESASRSLSTLQTLLQLIRYGTSLIGTVLLLITFNTPIVILCLISTIPMFYIGCSIMDKFYCIFNKRYEKIRFSKSIESLLIKNDNIKEIKIYRLGNFLKERILLIYEKNLSEDKHIRAKVAFQNVLANTFSLIIEIAIKILTIFISIQQNLSIGTVSMYISSIDNLILSISNFLSLLSNMYENTLYMRSIFNIINKDIDEDGKILLNGDIQNIEFKNVSFQYPGNKANILENINIKLEANKTYAFVGYNGAGKTTLIKLLLGLYEPTSGVIYLNGVDMKDFNKESLYRNVNAVFQDFVKYPFDIKTNIGVGSIENVNNKDMIKKAATNAEIDKFIESLPFDYDTQLSREWAESTDISLGQWQKIAIARAMMKQSSIIILDEPTASIDVVSEHEIFKKFEKLKENQLCVLVTHRLSNISLADKIYVLDNHRIIEEGSHESLIKEQGLYNKLYNLNTDMFEDKS